MPYDFELSTELPGSPEDIFDAWLSSEGHTAMTGGVAHIDPRVNGEFDAWDGYITGKSIELDRARRIVQSWRTQHFQASDPDSTIEVTLEPIAGGTRLTLNHRNVPDGQTSYEEGGWQTHYFEPMRRRFSWMKQNLGE